MKKIYFLAFSVCAFFVNAQFTDDMESYPEGPYFGGHWSTWSGTDSGTENVIISSDQALSGTQSGFIGGGGTQDAILKLGNKFSGIWTYSHSLYVPSASSGYHNFQEDENVTDGIWGIEVYFGYVATDFPDNNAFLVATDEITSTPIYLAGFDISYDTWFTMTWEYDMDEGLVTVWLDGNEIYTGLSYLDSFQLGGLDYYSADPSNQLYIDDIMFAEGPAMGVSDLTNSSISVYPTVATESFNVASKNTINEISIFNTAGQQVMRVAPNNSSAHISVNALQPGVYIVKISSAKEVKTSKIIVK